MLFAWQLVGNQSTAEDIVQTAFLRAWDRLSTLDRDKAYGWLRTVIRNLAIDHLRKHHRLQPLSDDFDTITNHADEKPVDQMLYDKRLSDQIHDALASLNDRQRLAITLSHYERLNAFEIGVMLEISEDAAESLLRRARAKLKTKLSSVYKEVTL